MVASGIRADVVSRCVQGLKALELRVDLGGEVVLDVANSGLERVSLAADLLFDLGEVALLLCDDLLQKLEVFTLLLAVLADLVEPAFEAFALVAELLDTDLKLHELRGICVFSYLGAYGFLHVLFEGRAELVDFLGWCHFAHGSPPRSHGSC